MQIKLLAMALALATTASTAQAEAVKIDTVDSWEIYRDADMGNGCYTTNQYQDDSLLMLGFDLSVDKAFITVFSPDLGALTEDELYAVDIHLDAAHYQADGTGITGDETQDGLLIFVDDEDFFVDLANGNQLTIAQGDTELVKLSLAASRAAVIATIDCLPAG